MMKRNGLGMLLLALVLVLAGCGNNKKNLDDKLFKDGETMLQGYYDALNGRNASEGIQAISEKFGQWEVDGTYSKNDEMIFIKEILLVEQEYQLYLATYALAYASGNKEGDVNGAKEDIINHMKELEKEFGVKYETK